MNDTWKIRPPGETATAATEPELFASSSWVRAVEETYGLTTDRLGNGMKSLPFAVLDDLAGRRISAFPFSDYLPIDSKQEADGMLSCLRTAYPDFAIVLKTRLSAEVADSLPETDITRRAVYHRVLPDTRRPTSNFMRGVRRAVKSGLVYSEENDAAAVTDFYRLYHRQRFDKFGSIPQPKQFFTTILRNFTPGGKVFFANARLPDGRLAASMLVLRSGRGLFYKFGTSDPESLSCYPNNFIFHRLLERLKDNDSDFLDLGLSGSSEAYAGLRRYKSSLGATEYPLTYLRYVPPGYEEGNAAAFKTHLAKLTGTIVAQNTDTDLTSALSSHLYPYFA